MPGRRVSFLSFLVALLVASCATTGELRKLEKEHLNLRTEFDTVRNKQARMQADLTKVMIKLHELDKIFKSFKKKGQYNFANLGVKMDELRTQFQELLGKHNIVKSDFDRLKASYEKLLQAYTARFGPPTPASGGTGNNAPGNRVTIQVVSPKALFDAGKALFDAGKYREARARLRLFLKKHKNHELADDAYILIGDCYSKLNNHFEAIIWYNDVRKKYKTGDKVDVALFKLGQSHFRIGACPEGKAFFHRLLRKHRSSPLRSNARKKLRNARRLCRKR